MLKRMVGKTGIEASIVGIGGEHLDTRPQEVSDEVIGAALDNGINILDIFMPGKEVRSHIGKTLAGRRQKMLIQGAIGSVDLREQYDISRDLTVCTRYFEDLLRCLNTDYIDFGMLFYLDSHESIDHMVNNGVVDYVRSLKQSGKVRAIGASTHNPETARRLVEEGMVDMLMFSINPAFDMMPDTVDIMEMLSDTPLEQRVSRIDPKRAALYQLCESRGVGITVMKSMAAGKLLSTDHSPFSKAMTPVQCIHYALTRPAVASVLVGCKTRQEVEAAAAYVRTSEADKDYSAAISAFRADGKAGFSGNCVYCNHCLPCAADINIAAVHKCLDMARLDEKHIPHDVLRQYAALEHQASQCLECGTCEERCPFSVSVMENMRSAVALLEK